MAGGHGTGELLLGGVQGPGGLKARQAGEAGGSSGRGSQLGGVTRTITLPSRAQEDCVFAQSRALQLQLHLRLHLLAVLCRRSPVLAFLILPLLLFRWGHVQQELQPLCSPLHGAQWVPREGLPLQPRGQEADPQQEGI